MADKISPQGYVIGLLPTNDNPFWGDGTPQGHGIPAGGNTGEVLTKKSDADYDVQWAQGGGVPGPASPVIVANLDDVYLGAIGAVMVEGWDSLVPTGILPFNMPDLTEYYHTNTMDNLFLEFNLTYNKVGGRDTILSVVRLPLIASNIASYFYIGGDVIFCRPSTDTDYIVFSYGVCTVTGGNDAIEISCHAHVTKSHNVMREYYARNARVVKY